MYRMYRWMGPVFVMVVVMLSAGLAAAQPASPHPIIGDWRVNTDGVGAGEPFREGNYAFGADGSILVVLQARPTGSGTAELLWWGEGTWEAEGEHAVRYTLSWPTLDAEHAATGTVTFDGVITIQDDGLTFADDRSQSLVTVRNQVGILVATYGADPTELTAAFTGERIVVGSR